MAAHRFFERNMTNAAILVAMIAVLIVAGFASWKQFERHSRIQQEVAVLEVEKERIRKENESLKERISYFATDNFQERESKERLNMRKDNEFVVDIERVPEREKMDAGVSESENTQKIDIPNYKKWWGKIF